MSPESQTLKQLATLLAEACNATSVAVWSGAFGELELRYSHDIAQRHINAAIGMWARSHDELQAGRTVSERGFTFVPLQNGRQHLVGLLALPVPLPQRDTARPFLDETLRLIARHVERPEPLPEPELVVVPLDALTEPGGIAVWLRYVYERVMLRFGWNVSLVAGLLGVPRATLASRLASAGAQRKRPSSKARPQRPGRTSMSDLDDAVLGLIFPREPAFRPPRRRKA